MTNSHYKNDFPIFANNPGLVFLDSGASAQKPKYVIDETTRFIEHDYANIHRWHYRLSEKSDEIYEASKTMIAKQLNCSADEIFYSYNATYGINMIAQSLKRSNFFSKWDKILLGVWDHHANIVPWQMLAEDLWLDIAFIQMKNPDNHDYSIDRDDFDQKYDNSVKLIAVWQVSNVTGQIYHIKKLKSKLHEHTFLLVDASQSIPHFAVNVNNLWCDALVFTGHKVMSYTGIWAVYLKKQWIKSLKPAFSGGGAIKEVTTQWASFPNNSMKFEPWTPDIIGAVSLLKAFEYIENIWGYDTLRNHELQLIEYALQGFEKLRDKVRLLGSYSKNNRVWVFSFFLPEQTNFNLLGEYFATHNICIRSGGHCAHPLHHQVHAPWTNRMSLYLYNNEEDIEYFFDKLRSFLYT